MARSNIDQIVHTHVARAIRELLLARDACFGFSRRVNRQVQELRQASEDPLVGSRQLEDMLQGMNEGNLHRAARKSDDTFQLLRQTIALLERVEKVSPDFDLRDPDTVRDAARSLRAGRERQERKDRSKQKKAGPHSSQYELDDGTE